MSSHNGKALDIAAIRKRRAAEEEVYLGEYRRRFAELEDMRREMRSLGMSVPAMRPRKPSRHLAAVRRAEEAKGFKGDVDPRAMPRKNRHGKPSTLAQLLERVEVGAQLDLNAMVDLLAERSLSKGGRAQLRKRISAVLTKWTGNALGPKHFERVAPGTYKRTV